jgi:hypothetical protein
LNLTGNKNYTMHKHFLFFILAIIVVFGNSCSPSKKSTVEVIASWVNKETVDSIKKVDAGKTNSVFIAVLTQNMSTRTTLEGDLAAEATANGIKAIRSLSVLTPVTGVPDSVLIGAFTRQVEKSGCNAVLIVSLIDSKSDTKYIPGSSYTYNPYSSYGYYGFYPTYYATTFNTISSPGYYVTDNTYYIESNLYDVASRGILFSIQTKAVNPNDVEKASKKFAETLIEEIKANGMLKKG